MKKLNKNMKKNRNKVLFFQSPCIFKVYLIRLRGHRLVEFGIRRELILERNDVRTIVDQSLSGIGACDIFDLCIADTEHLLELHTSVRIKV